MNVRKYFFIFRIMYFCALVFLYKNIFNFPFNQNYAYFH